MSHLRALVLIAVASVGLAVAPITSSPVAADGPAVPALVPTVILSQTTGVPVVLSALPQGTIAARYVAIDPTTMLSTVAEMRVREMGLAAEEARGVLRHPAKDVTIELLDGETVPFDGVQVTESHPVVVAADGTATAGPAVVQWIGQHHDAGALMGWATLTFVSDGLGFTVTGAIGDGGRNFTIEAVDSGTVLLRQYDISAGTPGGDATAPSGSSDSSAGATSPSDSAAGTSTQSATSPTVIDVLVGYANGLSDPTTAIQNVMAQENTAFANTAGMPEQVNLVGVVYVNYTQDPSNMSTDLTRLASGYGDLARLHSLRDSLGADVVGLVVPNDDNNGDGTYTCGIAYLPPANGNSDAMWFVVNRASTHGTTCGFNHLDFNHELGHTLGGNHDPAHCDANCGPYSFSRGHVENGVASTIMAYDFPCSSGCPRVLQYSTPAADFVGHPGHPAGVSGSQDNGASLLNLAPLVAAYRTPAPPPPISLYLRNSNTAGTADTIDSYGEQGDILLMCDWDGNGTSTPAVIRGTTWYVRNSNLPGTADITFSYGNIGDVPICGDWDGNDSQTPGIRRGNTWYLNNGFDGFADVTPFAYGDQSDIPLTGNWNGSLLDKSDTVGVVRNSVFYLTNRLDGSRDLTEFNFGVPSDTPVAGDWNGDRHDSIGIWRNAGWYLNNQNDASAPDYIFGYGNGTDKPLTGNWDDSLTNLTSTPGVAR